MDFETALIEKIKEIRARLAGADIAYLTLDILAEGRTDTGDIKIEFTVGPRYGDGGAKAGRLDAAVTEYMRRKGWNDANAPLCLPAFAPSGDEYLNQETN